MSLTLTVKPVINYRNKPSKSGLYSIHIRTTIERESRFIKLDKAPKISKNDWNKNSRGSYGNYVKNSHPLSFEINQEIQEFLDKIMKIVKRNHSTNLYFTELLKELKRKGDSNILTIMFENILKILIRN